MNRLKALLIVAALGTLVVIPAAAQKNDSARAMLEAAKQKETLEGDLAGAIKQYQAIVDKYSKTERAAAADALVAMAACYQKQGNAQERKLLERVVREFADQKDAVTIARTRLGSPAGTAGATGMTAAQIWQGPKVDIEGTVSPDGRYLSYADWETGDLALHDLTTGADRRLTNKGTWAQSSDFAEESTLSPDGTQVAYSWYDEAKQRFDVRILKLEPGGASKPRIAFDDPQINWIGPMNWSPDGKSLAVWIRRQDQTDQLGLLGTADGSLKILKSGTWRFWGRIFFSPDGKSIAYDSPRNGTAGARHDVFVRPLEGTEEIPVVAHPATDLVMGWTPDGRSLLFASDRAGSMGIWSQPLANGRPQGPPSFLKDAGNASMASLGLTRSGSLLYGVGIGAPHIEVASVDFSTGKVIVPPKQAVETYAHGNRFADWSPDGKSMLYVTELPGNGMALAIESVATGLSRGLPIAMANWNRPRWTPDGSAIIVQGTDTNKRQGIFRVDVRTGELSPLVLGPGAAQSSLSPDGKLLFYRRRDNSGTAVIERNLASGVERELVRRKTLIGLSLSPDGRQITFVEQDREAKMSALYTIPVNGGSARELFRAADPAIVQNLVEWTPDGQRLLFATLQDGKHSYWIIPSAGGTPTRLELVLENAVNSLRIHPDGRQVSFNAGTRKWEVWKLDNFLPATTAVKK
jgi:Tol biopolymer transport system component